jgi:mitochondrial fission protein ELM1
MSAMNIWGITGGRRGNEVLVEGVAQALGGTYRSVSTNLHAPWKWLAPYRLAEIAAKADGAIAPPFPDMVIASARQAVPHARYIKRASGQRVFTVFLQNPLIHPAHFDFVWTPAHDQIRGANVRQTLLSPHAMRQPDLEKAADAFRDRLVPRVLSGKLVSVLIGGPNAVYPFGPEEMRALADGLANLAKQGHHLLITLSRRSPDTYAALLRQTLPEGRYFLWDNEGANPYRALLGLAEQIIVTADSVNMVGEACLPGVPVQVFGLKGGSAKFRRFHTAIKAADFVRPFTDALEVWPVQSQNATPEIGQAIAEAYARHLKLLS